MNLLSEKKALIFGVANKYSIAWAIAEAFKQQGADVGLSYGIPQLEKRVMPLAEELGVTFVEKCDVTSDAEIDDVFDKAANHFGEIDILIHSVAYAPSEELEGRFYDTTREGFRIALDISASLRQAAAGRQSPAARTRVRETHLAYHNPDAALFFCAAAAVTRRGRFRPASTLRRATVCPR